MDMKRSGHQSRGTDKARKTQPVMVITPESSKTSGKAKSTSKTSQRKVVPPSPQTEFTEVPRTWPLWLNIDHISVANVERPNPLHYSETTHTTPMERWEMETMKQSPWNNIAAVNTASKKEDIRAQEEQKGGDGHDIDEGWSWMATNNSGTQEFREM